MPTTVEDLYGQALLLPDESKESLAERLVSYLEAHIDPAVERHHLDTAKRRLDEIRSGRVCAVDGEKVMARGRQAVGR